MSSFAFMIFRIIYNALFKPKEKQSLIFLVFIGDSEIFIVCRMEYRDVQDY